MIFIEQVATYLQAQGIGTIASDIFIGNMPDLPNNCIAVINTGGIAPSIDIPDKRPTFQVLIRNTDYETGELKLTAIRTALHQFMNDYLVNGQTYVYSIFLNAEGGHIGKDVNGRDEWSVNFNSKTR